MANFLSQNNIEPTGLVWSLVILIIIGSVIIGVVGALIFFIPAAVIAGVVWYITGDQTFTGVAFLLVSILSLTKRK